jgi:hypothetical protein
MQIVLRPTPKQEQTVGPGSAPFSTGAAGQQADTVDLAQLLLDEQAGQPGARRHVLALRHEQALVDAAVDQVHGAVHAAGAVFDSIQSASIVLHAASSSRAQSAEVLENGIAAGQFVADEFAALDAGPVAALSQRQLAAAEDEAVPVATPKGSMRTGVCLNSGSPETGSTAGLTSAPTRASDAVWPLQWIGMNTLPRAMPPPCCTRATTAPQRLMRASSPSFTPHSSASCGCMSMKGSARDRPAWPSGRCASWCATGRARGRCSAPAGYSLTGLAGQARRGGTKRALPSAWAKTPIAEQALHLQLAGSGAAHRPLGRFQRIVFGARSGRPGRRCRTARRWPTAPFASRSGAHARRRSGAAPQKSKPLKPMRARTSQTMSQSGARCPGAGRKARWREMQRSELVTVPSFSPQPSAGSSTWASRIAVGAGTMSEATTSSHFPARAAPGRRPAG